MKVKNTVPYSTLPTYCLEIKVDRIDDLIEKISEYTTSSELTLTIEDFQHIRAMLRELQYCCENSYNERKEKQQQLLKG